jgi:nucleoside 2-deoxyribosyltransferase
MRAYLAGPDVFFPSAIEIGQAKKDICVRFGFQGVYPLDADFSGLLEIGSPSKWGYRSFDLMVQLMDSCDLAIANMTPFRGPSMDVGTAVEIGYMHGRGKPVFGYTNVMTHFEERLQPDGFLVEPFGMVDNCMVEGPVHKTGAVVVRADVPRDQIYASLEAFEETVRQASELMAKRRHSCP